MPDSSRTRRLIEQSKMSLPEQEIERRKENANKLVKEGKIGGAEFGKLGGRPRKQTANQLAAEAARESAEDIVQAFRSALDPKQPPYVRMQAAIQWLKIEANETERTSKVEIDEDREELMKELREFMRDNSIEVEPIGPEPARINGSGSKDEGTQEETGS
jgi:hypothetical protein